MSWREKTQQYEPVAYCIGLAMMAASLTLSPFMMSVSQFFLLAAWLFLGDPVKVKLHRFFHNKIALLLVAVYLMHLLGLAYTSDFHYAANDLRVKLPLLFFPLLLSSIKPLSKRHLDLVMLFYVASVFVGTCFSFATWVRHDYTDIREISRFISHIRFCLNIVLSMGIIVFYLFEQRISKGKDVPPFSLKAALNHCLMYFLLMWFAYQIYLFESLSGYVTLAGMLVASVAYLFFTKVQSKGWRTVGAAVLIVTPLLAGLWFYRTVSSMMAVAPVDLSVLDRKTAQGNDYWHDTVCFPVENGQYVGLYICRPELREAWNERSSFDYDSVTANGENLEATLVRYLSSKGLRKDAEGVKALDEEDIHNVEQGVANYLNWSHPGIYSRLQETLFEYSQYKRRNNPNGGSLSQRLEYTRASLHLIKRHPLFGVGTGDVAAAYQRAYDELQSPLDPQYRHKAHNQYLAITVAFGFVGLALFLIALVLPYLKEQRCRTFLYTAFLVIALLSMLPEDTLETQAGASWFALFNSLFIFALDKGKAASKKDIA